MACLLRPGRDVSGLLGQRYEPVAGDVTDASCLAPAWTCSSAKAERLLGFRATRDVADAIRRSAHWFREHGWL